MDTGLDCQNDCQPTPDFPRRIDNRPGLNRIGYRIGSYAELYEAILRCINQEPALAGWTHRQPDDPAIALLEGAAIVGDVLTFYQEQYANELYLRTARWRESVADLVRLLGYRLAPGLGGRATFAFAFRGSNPVTIPKGFPIKVQLTGVEGTVDFETSQEAQAHPALGQFHLYAPSYSPPFAAATTVLAIRTADLAAAGVTLQPKDRLMLLDAGHEPTNNAQVVVVKAVAPRFDYTEITIEGAWRHGNGLSSVLAYKLGRTFRHFGHNAPSQVVKLSGTTASQVSITYNRLLHDITSTISGTTISPDLSSLEYPLDKEVNDLAVGSRMIVEQVAAHQSTVVRTIVAFRPVSCTWGALTGSATLVTFDAEIDELRKGHIYVKTDIRLLVLHETVGRGFTLTTPRQAQPSRFGSYLMFYGDGSTYEQLRGRRLIFVKPDGAQIERTVDLDSSERSSSNQARFRRLILSAPLDEGFSPADFSLDRPTVTVYGNLADATQGKTEKTVVLGNGDNRQQFQTFQLPKKPLTYLLDPAAVPPQAPELEICVQNRLWRAVPSLFGRGPDEEIYIVREDETGASWVQFGDGLTGKRLPSGTANVTAVYRTGNGAFGEIRPNTTVQAAGKLVNLDKMYLPGLATGGTPPESEANARHAAPGKVQSLDRMVSLSDYAAEALTIPGVDRAEATWGLVDNVPGVVLTVLMETGRGAEINAVRATLQHYNRCRGPQRYPIHVRQGSRLYVRVLLSVAFDPIYQRPLVEDAIRAALGETGDDGLFSFGRRDFGQPEYAGRISGVVQNVPGVLWNQVTGLFLQGEADDPLAPHGSSTRINRQTLPCDSLHLLSLHSGAVSFTAVATPEEVC
jgi:hypothetical protein